MNYEDRLFCLWGLRPINSLINKEIFQIHVMPEPRTITTSVVIDINDADTFIFSTSIGTVFMMTT